MTEPSKHSGGRRKAVRQKPERAPRTGGSRARTAEPVRRGSGVSSFAWARTPWGTVLIGAVVILLAFVVRWAVGGKDDQKKTSGGPVGPALTTYGADWKAKDGSSYRLTVTPIAELVSSASADGCVPAPGAGRANLRFTVRIDNRGSKAAPVPDLELAVNTKADGSIAKKLSFEKSSRALDITPTSAHDCPGAARIVGAGQPKIAPQSATTFTGMISGVKTPIGPGLTLQVRYSQADAGSPSGSGTADVVVLYPDMRALS